jgi:NADH-quinone oxidoreductase subunit J
MEIEITSALFYLFAGILTLAALCVISARNPVYSVFFLILGFFNAAGLFVLLGAEYIAMTLVIVYVGAVAVLFLFVVMMLNINTEKLRAGFIRNLPLGLMLALLMFAELGALLYVSYESPMSTVAASLPIPASTEVTNAAAIGQVIYTRFALLFQLSGIILLVAMIGAIVLTHRVRTGVRKQSISKQNARRRQDSVELVKIVPGQGIEGGI